MTLSLRDWKMNMDMMTNMTPRIELMMAKIGLPLIFALIMLSKFWLMSPTRSPSKLSYSSFLTSSLFGAFIMKSSSIGVSSKLKASPYSASGW